MLRAAAATVGLALVGLAGGALAAASGSASRVVTVSIGDGTIEAPASVTAGSISFVVVNTGKSPHRLAISSEVGVAGVSAVAAHGARVRLTVYLAPDVYTLADPAAAGVRQRRLNVPTAVTQPTTTAPTCHDTTPQCIGSVVEEG